MGDPTAGDIDWPRIHEEVVAGFAEAWQHPHPRAWDSILDDGVVLAQPMLPTVTGPEAWGAEVERLLTLLPDLRVDVVDWAGRADRLFIRIRFVADLAGAPLTWEAVDAMHLSAEGRITRRDSLFDPTVPMAAIARRPQSWSRWWRSGMAPLSIRQRWLRR